MPTLACNGYANIATSRWSISSETLDRDYADYQFLKCNWQHCHERLMKQAEEK